MPTQPSKSSQHLCIHSKIAKFFTSPNGEYSNCPSWGCGFYPCSLAYGWNLTYWSKDFAKRLPIHSYISIGCSMYFNTLLPRHGILGKWIHNAANLASIYVFNPRLQNFLLLSIAQLVAQRSVRLGVLGLSPAQVIQVSTFAMGLFLSIVFENVDSAAKDTFLLVQFTNQSLLKKCLTQTNPEV